jgi:PII-like signaling protein
VIVGEIRVPMRVQEVVVEAGDRAGVQGATVLVGIMGRVVNLRHNLRPEPIPTIVKLLV